MFVVETRW